MKMKGIIEHSILCADAEIYTQKEKNVIHRERQWVKFFTRLSVRLKFMRSNRVKDRVSSKSENSNRWL